MVANWDMVIFIGVAINFSCVQSFCIHRSTVRTISLVGCWFWEVVVVLAATMGVLMLVALVSWWLQVLMVVTNYLVDSDH